LGRSFKRFFSPFLKVYNTTNGKTAGKNKPFSNLNFKLVFLGKFFFFFDFQKNKRKKTFSPKNFLGKIFFFLEGFFFSVTPTKKSFFGVKKGALLLNAFFFIFFFHLKSLKKKVPGPFFFGVKKFF